MNSLPCVSRAARPGVDALRKSGMRSSVGVEVLIYSPCGVEGIINPLAKHCKISLHPSPSKKHRSLRMAHGKNRFLYKQRIVHFYVCWREVMQSACPNSNCQPYPITNATRTLQSVTALTSKSEGIRHTGVETGVRSCKRSQVFWCEAV